MFQRSLAVGYSVVLFSFLMPTAYAQDWAYNPYGNGQMPGPGSFQPVSGQVPTQPPTPIDADVGAGPAAAPVQQQGYVRLGAPMYPTPRPNIPIWAGSTVITNQAFAPQEMLYPHTYKSIYPPFYHRVKGGWILTPLGVRSHEKWELQGTEVTVKYRSTYPGLFSGAMWCPPHTSTNGIGSWR